MSSYFSLEDIFYILIMQYILLQKLKMQVKITMSQDNLLQMRFMYHHDADAALSHNSRATGVAVLAKAFPLINRPIIDH